MTGLNSIIRMILLVAAIPWISGCQDEHQWNQKLTVVLDTPSGRISGSSIVAVQARFGQLPLSNNEVNYRIRGEATAVEVIPGRYLFALLDGDEERYFRAVREKIGNRDRGEWLNLIPKMDEVAILKPENYPMLVSFGDVDDPKSVQQVDPLNLAATFGPGVKLNSISLEITEEPPAIGQLDELGFMKALNSQSTLSGLQAYDEEYPDPVFYLTRRAFKTDK